MSGWCPPVIFRDFWFPNVLSVNLGPAAGTLHLGFEQMAVWQSRKPPMQPESKLSFLLKWRNNEIITVKEWK